MKYESTAHIFRDAVKSMWKHNKDGALVLLETYLENNQAKYSGADLHQISTLVSVLRDGAISMDQQPKLTLEKVQNYLTDVEIYRGRDIVQHVHNIVYQEDITAAYVVGTQEYETWAALDEERNIIDSSCTCPVRSVRCKHVAAILLRQIEDESKDGFTTEQIKDTLLDVALGML